MDVKISIIVPIYNAEKYLHRCLDSIKNQTYQELEILLIDDGSTDKSSEICLRYEKDYPIFSYHRRENGGVSKARNNGMELAEGNWICFVDSDDYLEPDMIERLCEHIDENVDVVSCGCIAEVGKESINNPFFENDMVFHENKRELIMQLLDNNYHAPQYRYTAIGVPWGKLYRRSFLQENRIIFDAELKRMQDNIFNMEVFFRAREIRYRNYLGYHYVVDHVVKYADIYDNNASEYLSKIIKVQIEKLEFMQLISDKKVYNSLVKEALRLYILAVQKSYYSCSEMNYFEKCKAAKKLLRRKPFGDLFYEKHCIKSVYLLKFLVNANLITFLIEGKRIWKKL